MAVLYYTNVVGGICMMNLFCYLSLTIVAVIWHASCTQGKIHKIRI
jgi:hypothetical protein